MPKPKIVLNNTLLEAVIKLRFKGDVAELIEEWEAREPGHHSSGTRVPNRTTLYRWIKGKNFPRGELYLHLCGLLDIDPFSLLMLPEGREQEVIARLTSMFWRDRWEPAALRFLREFYGQQHVWPPVDIAKWYYGRPWHYEEIKYTVPRPSDHFAQIEIAGRGNEGGAIPQVWHFAFRRRESFENRWTQYGFVSRQRQSVRLYHIRGHVDRYETHSADDYTLVETWVGPSRPVTFRIASLHSFSITVRDFETPTTERVRFIA